MEISLLNQRDYRYFNINIAKALNLSCAVYLCEIINIANEDSTVNIDTAYITEQTSLQEDEQSQVREALMSLKIIEYVQDDCYILNLDNINKLVSGKVKKTAKIRKIAPAGGKLTIREKQCNNLKATLTCSNEELLQAYMDWIDGVYANPKGFLSYKSINIFKQTVDEFAKGDLDLALKIVDIATVNGYRDATWAINVFRKDYERDWNKSHGIVTSSTPPRSVALSGEVF